jgi:YaiO family outer membrane protein
LRTLLAADPQQAEARFLLARSLLWQGDFEAAAVEYQQLLQADPENTDYMLGLAQARLRNSQPEQALPVISRAREINPGDPDIWRTEVLTLAALGPEQQTAAIALQDEAAQRFPQQTWNIVAVTQEVAPPPGARLIQDVDRRFSIVQKQQIELSTFRDYLSGDYDNWKGVQLDYEYRFAPRQIVYGALTRSERFDETDHELLAGFYYPLTPRLTLNAEASHSPAHKVVAENTALASLQYAIGKGWVVTGGIRHAEYNAATATQLPLGLEYYFGPFLASYSPTATFISGHTLYNHRVQFSYYYDDISYATLSYSRGEESDEFQSSFLVSDVYTYGINGRHWLNQKWAISWDLSKTQQGSFYERSGFRLGLRRAF